MSKSAYSNKKVMVIPYIHNKGNIEKFTYDHVIIMPFPWDPLRRPPFVAAEPEIFLSAEKHFRSFPSRKRESHNLLCLLRRLDSINRFR